LLPVSTTPTANFVTSFASVVDTGVNDTGGHFPPVYSGASGKLIHAKKPEVKNLVTLSL
jgi:hypothetical protein